jgi:hypothetical protein
MQITVGVQQSTKAIIRKKVPKVNPKAAIKYNRRNNKAKEGENSWFLSKYVSYSCNLELSLYLVSFRHCTIIFCQEMKTHCATLPRSAA